MLQRTDRSNSNWSTDCAIASNSACQPFLPRPRLRLTGIRKSVFLASLDLVPGVTAGQCGPLLQTTVRSTGNQVGVGFHSSRLCRKGVKQASTGGQTDTTCSAGRSSAPSLVKTQAGPDASIAVAAGASARLLAISLLVGWLVQSGRLPQDTAGVLSQVLEPGPDLPSADAGFCVQPGTASHCCRHVH